MSIFLPYGLSYNLKKCRSSLEELLLPLGSQEEYVKTPASQRAERTISLVRILQQTLKDLAGLPMSLKKAGIPENKLEEIAKTAINDGTIIMNPVKVTYDDAMSVLNEAYDV